MSKISVVIPNYNNAIYLKRCLESVINQTFKDLEIICIDDKSTDNSLNILEDFAKKDKRIQLISLAVNGGVSNARNIALTKLTGEYVCFLDSDDYLESTSCEELYASIIKATSDLACGGHIKVNKDNKRISAWLPKKDVSMTPAKDIYEFTKHRNVTQKLFKVDIIRQNNLIFNKDLNYMEDALFLVNYLKYCKLISGVKKVLYNVQINPNSLCRNINFKDRRESDKLKASSLINNK